jgi:hypothetical protein
MKRHYKLAILGCILILPAYMMYTPNTYTQPVQQEVITTPIAKFQKQFTSFDLVWDYSTDVYARGIPFGKSSYDSEIVLTLTPNKEDFTEAKLRLISHTDGYHYQDTETLGQMEITKLFLKQFHPNPEELTNLWASYLISKGDIVTFKIKDQFYDYGGLTFRFNQSYDKDGEIRHIVVTKTLTTEERKTRGR